MATPESTPDTNAITAELTRIESDWPRIIKEHDAAAIRRFEADDAVFIYPDGSIGNKEQDVKDMESGAITADSWEVSDIKVNVLDKNAAVVTGRTIVKNGKYNNQPFPADQFRWVDTYVRRDGQWQLVAGASTPLPKGATAPSRFAGAKGFARNEELAGGENSVASAAENNALVESFSRVRIRPVAGATVKDW